MKKQDEKITEHLAKIKKLITKAKMEQYTICEGELLNEIETITEAWEEAEKEIEEYRDFGLDRDGKEELDGEIEELKERVSELEGMYVINNTDGLNNYQKVEILQRLFNNLSLDQLTSLEGKCKLHPEFNKAGRFYNEFI